MVRHSPAGNAATYRPIPVTVKETTAVAWICLPDHPYPPDTAVAAISTTAGATTIVHRGKARWLPVHGQMCTLSPYEHTAQPISDSAALTPR